MLTSASTLNQVHACQIMTEVATVSTVAKNKYSGKAGGRSPNKKGATKVRKPFTRVRATRGVAMSIASFDGPHSLITWLGVGNVQGVLLRRGSKPAAAEESLLLRGGVVGVQLPSLQAAVLPISIGDTLVFATDGISVDFSRRLARNYPPQPAAESILAQHGKATDDALVLVARYVGDRP